MQKMSIIETELFFRKNREKGKEPFSVLTLTLSFYSPERHFSLVPMAGLSLILFFR